MIGNFLFFLSLVFFVCLAKLFHGPKPGGDYGVGFSFALLLYSIGFFMSTGLLVWNMQIQKRFEPVLASSMKYQTLVILLVWVSFLVSLFWALEYQNKWIQGEFPIYLRWLIFSKIHFWLPILFFIPCLYFLNSEQLQTLPASLAKFTLRIGVIVTLLISLTLLGSFSKSWMQRSAGKTAAQKLWQSDQREKYQASIDYIRNYKDSTINGLLKFLDPEDDSERRKQAIAKIKSFPNWEDDMIKILTKKDLEKTYIYEDDTYFVFAFLIDNKTEHPEKFIEPIKYSLQVFAKRAEKDLEDPYDRDLWRLNLDKVCRILTVQFKKNAIDFRPEMIRLSEVLNVDVPERKSKPHRHWYQKMLKNYRNAVNEWLHANQ